MESRKVCPSTYNDFISNGICDNSSNLNPKRLSSYIKRKKVDKVGVGPLREQGSVYIDSKKKKKPEY